MFSKYFFGATSLQIPKGRELLCDYGEDFWLGYDRLHERYKDLTKNFVKRDVAEEKIKEAQAQVEKERAEKEALQRKLDELMKQQQQQQQQ